MEAKEKAEELVSKFISLQDKWYLQNLVDGQRMSQAKQCALILVDEIFQIDFYPMPQEPFDELMYFWNEVKNEIEKL